jgi:hypothetical protein
VAIVGYHELVVLEQAASVGNSKESDFELLGLEVEFSLDVHAHRAGALIQNGEDGLVVEESGHRDALLLTA